MPSSKGPTDNRRATSRAAAATPSLDTRCPQTAGRCEKDAGHNGGHYTEYKEPVWSWTVEAAAATPSLDRCDRIVNNGMGEPTECGRNLPCEYHDDETADEHLATHGCNVYHAGSPCRWQSARLDEGSATPDRTHPDAGNIEANHYDRFTAGEAAYVLDNLDAWRAKYEEALTDPFVHDHAKVALVLIDAIRAQGKGEPR